MVPNDPRHAVRVQNSLPGIMACGPATSTIASSDVAEGRHVRTATLVLLGVATVGGGLGAQSRPNFSGKWLVVPSRSVMSNDAGTPVNITVLGEAFTADQTQDALTIAIDSEEGFKGFRWVYRLDGQVSHNDVPGPNGPQPTSSTTAWSGSELVITTRGVADRDSQPRSWETTRTLKLNDDGTLRVEAPWGRSGAMIGSVYARSR
jgi:hypothetical protein